jgi:hypothetical protein
MPTTKGITTIPNTAAMAGPAQMSQIAADVDARLPASVPKVADLAALPDKWLGRIQSVDEDGGTYIYTGTTNGWQALASPVVSGTITPATGVSIDTRSYLKRRGKQVTMLLAVGRTSGVFSTNQGLATIPAAFRPVTGTIGVMGVYTTGAAPGTCSVYVNTDGTIAIAGYSTVNGATSMVVVVSYEI